MDPIITFPILGEWLSIGIPRYFTVFGFNIYYYALCIVLGFGLAALYIVKRRDIFGLTTDNVLDILLIAVPCGIIGARIYYMLFNFDDFFGPGKWSNIWNLRSGGLAVYGGIIASAIGFIIYSKVKKIALGSLLDAAGFGLFIGQAIGRWGNFINREAYGVETDLPWKMGLTARGVTTYHHPAFLYESLWNVAGLLIMHFFSKKYKTRRPGQYFMFYVAWYGLGRFMIEGLRVDSLYIPGTELRVSQWLAAISMIIAVILLLYNQFAEKDDDEDDDDETGDDSRVGGDVETGEEGYEESDEVDDDDETGDGDEDIESDGELAKLDGAESADIDDETDDDANADESDREQEQADIVEELEALDGAQKDE